MRNTPEITAGSRGERTLQELYGTGSRAAAFYAHQVLDHLNRRMRDFIARQDMFFVATADGRGECDVSFRAGEPGFVYTLDEKHLFYPEYRGNGVMASLGNISENPHVGLLFLDFFLDRVGLHVNGSARILSNEELLDRPDLPAGPREDLAEANGRCPERWVLVGVDEAYIHCSKHIPLLRRADVARHWSCDDPSAKGGDYFRAKACQHRPGL